MKIKDLENCITSINEKTIPMRMIVEEICVSIDEKYLQEKLGKKEIKWEWKSNCYTIGYVYDEKDHRNIRNKIRTFMPGRKHPAELEENWEIEKLEVHFRNFFEEEKIII